jgi:hypothetical protein
MAEYSLPGATASTTRELTAEPRARRDAKIQLLYV